MKLCRIVCLILFAVAFGPPVFGQGGIVNTTITGTGCASIDVTGKGVVGISVTNSGTAWSGTIQPEVAIGGDAAQNTTVTPYNSTTSQSTITANGVYQSFVSGATTFFLCGNTVTNIAGIKLQVVPLAAKIGGGGGGLPGSGTNPFTATSTLALPLGSSSATALNFGTANTGFFSAGATDIEAAVSGSVRFQLFSSTMYGPGTFCGEASQTSCLSLAAASWTLTGSSNPNFGFGQGKGQHFINQAAASDMAGTVGVASSTTASVSFTTAYTATPACVLTPQTTGLTSWYLSAISTAGFTVTVAPSGTYTFGYICVGNPN